MSLQRKLGIIEAFVPLIEYPNYAASNYGKAARILKLGIDKGGYLIVTLLKHNIKSTKLFINWS